MNKFSNALSGAMDALNVPLQERNKLTVLAIARSLGYYLAMPTSEVGDIYSYYNTTHRGMVEAMISSMNEVTIFDIDAALDLTLKVYSMRYRLVFQPDRVETAQLLDLILLSGPQEVPAQYLAVATGEFAGRLPILTTAIRKVLLEPGAN